MEDRPGARATAAAWSLAEAVDLHVDEAVVIQNSNTLSLRLLPCERGAASWDLLGTGGGGLFVDLETCCRGPAEFDVAHVPDEVSVHYPGVDQVLLQECRRLVLALVAAWRWDVRDEFPHGRRYADQILVLLRDGPPWPALGALSTE